ncbi:hypothetical protein NVP1243O_75 [Vibrio phage 1.243.O._10N.261.54.B5]|nr:hypothetical protein NVP1243O_75 [Vibrio phage 1.243.O._10N.261.54.B5]
MKTFETEKHNIPKGATHYSNENDDNYFLWCKVDIDGQVWGVVEDESLLATVEKIQKPRTETEFVKVEYNHAWEIIKLYEDGEELFKTDSDELQIERINSIALRAQARYPFYRKVETEIDERQEFIDTACAINEKAHGERRQYLVESMYDSGKFKLVEK